MNTKQIIVTGANGQLGMEFRSLINSSDYHFTFLSSKELDISSRSSVLTYFEHNEADVIINCAAYTKVDLAESEKKKAFDVNTNGVKNLLDVMSQDCILLHYSTDYVYQAQSGHPIKENEKTSPLNVYAASKLAGDQHVLESNKKAIVIRTSWVYSSYGQNFVKTMLRLADKLSELKVVNDQIGAPTYAKDLATSSLSIIDQLLHSKDYSVFNKVYHYSNKGVISWYDFAKKIFAQSNKNIPLISIPSSEYPTPASRPSWSVLDCTSIQDTFGVEIYDWTYSLTQCLNKIQAN